MNCKEYIWKDRTGEIRSSMACSTKPNHSRWKLGPLSGAGRLLQVRLGKYALLFGFRAYEIFADEVFTGFRLRRVVGGFLVPWNARTFIV